MQQDTIAIKVEGLSKTYKLYDRPIDRLKEALHVSKKNYHKEFYALRDISFEIKKGETIGIIGTNGSGKSTLLKILTGVLNATTGTISVNGKISALLELGAGFNMEYTGIENIYLNGTIMGYTREEMEKRISEILEFADIGDFINQPVKTYSSGMFVRLAFAVAINIDPEILIVDEALSVGDVFFQTKCYKKFEEFKNAGKTILLVSHDLGSINKYCDRVILLNQGHKLREGKAKEVIDDYKKLLVNQLSDSSLKQENQNRILEQTSWNENLIVNPKSIEYGDQIAKIIDFAILDAQGFITNQIGKDTFFTIKIKVAFYGSIKNPIVAFTIKDVKGTELTGTNTYYEEKNISAKENGDYCVVSFTQEMNLHNGEYLLSLGCTEFLDTNFVVHHRLYDICNILVSSQKNAVGYYDMNSKIEILE